LHVFDAGWDTCLIKSVDILAQLAVSSGIVWRLKVILLLVYCLTPVLRHKLESE
jgi:hypothetical protein